MKECFALLKKYRRILTRQQVLTFKGQILSGDFDGFRKGIDNVLDKMIWEDWDCEVCDTKSS